MKGRRGAYNFMGQNERKTALKFVGLEAGRDAD